MANKIPASIEISPQQAIANQDLKGLVPAGARVYITDVGTDSAATMTTAARRVQDFGYSAVPHFACRRVTTRQALQQRIQMLTGDAGVEDVLIIGGGLETQAGEFGSTMQVLETGFFDQYGINKIGVAGHPEGSPDFDDRAAEQALRLKQAFAETTDSTLRIVTQFGFDAPKFIAWADALATKGIALPVHIGVAGPAKLTTLIKFAAMCGVGNSLQFLKKRSAAMATLLTGFNPDEVVNPIEQHVLSNPASAITQIHVFPFGGLKKSAEWLAERGSWVV